MPSACAHTSYCHILQFCPTRCAPLPPPHLPPLPSPHLQAFIYKYIPIIGPIFGSAFIVGLYLLARLLRGDLTDRLKMMDEGEQKRQRTAKKEARIAFLEEEVPALVAKGATFGEGPANCYLRDMCCLLHCLLCCLLRAACWWDFVLPAFVPCTEAQSQPEAAAPDAMLLHSLRIHRRSSTCPCPPPPRVPPGPLHQDQ